MTPSKRTTVRSVTTEHGTVDVQLTEQGSGRTVLLLHGGAGPQSVTAFADLLAGTRDAQVVTPTHPGFGGTTRPGPVDSIRALAGVYGALLDELDLHDVTVVGNSIGGWIAAEIALRHSPRVAAVVLVDAVGLVSESHPIADFFALTLDEVADLSYADPDRFRIVVDDLPEPVRAAMPGNRAALLAYGGTAMSDASLLGRLPGIDVPALVVWGAADRIVDPEHGRTYAEQIPGATLDVIAEAGHLPQLETPERLVADVWDFVGSRS